MRQCRKSQPSSYLLGDFDLKDPHLVCLRIPRQLPVVWVGVIRQIYTSIDQGTTCIYIKLIVSLLQLLE